MREENSHKWGPGGKQQQYSHSQESKGNWHSCRCRIMSFVELWLTVGLISSPKWLGCSTRKWYCKWSGRMKNYDSDSDKLQGKQILQQVLQQARKQQWHWLQILSWGQLSPAATERRSSENRAQPWQRFLHTAENWKASKKDHYLYTALTLKPVKPVPSYVPSSFLSVNLLWLYGTIQ